MHNYTTNSQTPGTEYTSIFSPFDAETVQGKMRLNLDTSEGLHRVNALINNHFQRKGSLNPHQAVVELKYKLNHMNLDFPFTAQQPLENGTNTFEVNHGQVFGATPETDLSKGFDHGTDLPRYRLTVVLGKDEGGFKLSGKLEPATSAIAEQIQENDKKEKRLDNVKKMLKNKKKK